MYDVNAVERIVKRFGADRLISYLLGDLDESVRAKFVETHLLVGGYPNLTLIYSFVWFLSPVSPTAINSRQKQTSPLSQDLGLVYLCFYITKSPALAVILKRFYGPVLTQVGAYLNIPGFLAFGKHTRHI